MLNFPSPPSPPINASQLANLADYYRSLVDYYHRASEIASLQLAHVEALLHPNDKLAFGSSDDLNCWLETPLTNGGRQKAIASPLPQLLATEISEILQTNEEEPPPAIEERSETDSQLMELLEGELESNRGKMLHLDYLTRKLFGESDPSQLESATEKTRTLLSQGAQAQKWFAAPDSPDCWTIDLAEFPDLSEPTNSSPKKQSYPARTTLVGSERLARYTTVADAIAACLAEHYPDSMTTKQIANWFYPDGISPSSRQKIHASLGKVLSEGTNKFWRRVRMGQYIGKNR